MSKANEPTRQYWDANLFLDLINATPGHADTLGRLWDDLGGKEPKAKACTSVLSMAEVSFAVHERELYKLDSGVLLKIDGFWSTKSTS